MTDPTKFPSGAITLSEVCNHYSISRDMNSLRILHPTLYDNAGIASIIPSSGAISLSMFRGKYSKSYSSGIISGSVNFSATDYNVGIAVSRVDCTVSYIGTYTIGGGSVIKANITFNVNPRVGYDNKGGVSAGYRDEVLSVNGNACIFGPNTLSFTNTQSLTIYAKATVYSNGAYGASNYDSLTDNYSASGTLGTGTLLTKQ